MLNVQPTDAQACQVVPPVHPSCKVFCLCEISARAKALRKQGQFLQAQELVDAVLCVCRKGPHHNQ